MRKKLPPKGGKGGVAHWAHRLYTRCLLIKLPHLMFGSAAGKELDIGAFVPRDTTRKDHRIRLCDMHVRCELHVYYLSLNSMLYLPV